MRRLGPDVPSPGYRILAQPTPDSSILAVAATMPVPAGAQSAPLGAQEAVSMAASSQSGSW